jgi:predicted transposase YbfD/YdcC
VITTREHWAIEDRLHWVRDVAFDEDRSQVRTRNGPRTMASLPAAVRDRV